MNTPPLPSVVPRFCIRCGAPITFTEIEIRPRQGQALWECSQCGHSSGCGWSALTAGETQSPVASPALHIDESGATKIGLSHRDHTLPPHDPPIAPEALAQEERVDRQIQDRGMAAIVELAPFPIFALTEHDRILLPQAYSFGRMLWNVGQPAQPLLNSFGLTYAGPSHDQPVEIVMIEQKDMQRQPDQLYANAVDSEYEAFSIAAFLSGLAHSELPALRDSWKEKSIHQFINIQAVQTAPVTYLPIRFHSGEQTQWRIRRFSTPLPIVHAWALVERTLIEMAAAGPAAVDIARLLGHFVRLAPGNPEVDSLNRGIQAYMEYLQRRYWNDV